MANKKKRRLSTPKAEAAPQIEVPAKLEDRAAVLRTKTRFQKRALFLKNLAMQSRQRALNIA